MFPLKFNTMLEIGNPKNACKQSPNAQLATEKLLDKISVLHVIELTYINKIDFYFHSDFNRSEDLMNVFNPAMLCDACFVTTQPTNHNQLRGKKSAFTYQKHNWNVCVCVTMYMHVHWCYVQIQCMYYSAIDT